MEFVDGFPRTRRQNDSIWIIVDRLTKSAHFILVKSTYTVEECTRLYLNQIVNLHGFSCPSSRVEMLNSLLIFGGLFKRG